MSNLYYDPGPAASGQKVFLATPSYDDPDCSYVFSVARSRGALMADGIQSAYYLLQGNCSVDDARNTIVRDFLASDCTDLIFLDADVSWEPEQLVALCRFDCDIVGGVYPYRRDGHGESMPVRHMADTFIPDENGLLEVEGLPTGFLRIRRHVLEGMASEAQSFRKDADGAIPLLFERDIFNGGRRGGDIHFCMKWRAKGGRLFAAAELRLGHCGKQVIRDSLAASLRRQMGTSIAHVVEKVRTGTEAPEHVHEAFKAYANPWAAAPEILALVVKLARQAKGPIVETGSGLSTVLMAAANPDQQVWCIEHDRIHAMKLHRMVEETGLKNVVLVTCPIRDDWYDIADDRSVMPKDWALALVDGPPRIFGNRMRFFDEFGRKCKLIVADDADDAGYLGKLRDWASGNGFRVENDRRAAVIFPENADG